METSSVHVSTEVGLRMRTNGNLESRVPCYYHELQAELILNMLIVQVVMVADIEKSS